MERWKQQIRKVKAYIPGEQPQGIGQLIKLNTNENPYPPAPGVERKLKEMNSDSFRLYPDDKSSVLVHALAENLELMPDQIFVGVGSDDVLATAFLTFFNSEEPVLFPDVTYSFYEVWAGLYRIPFEKVPLDKSFRLHPEDYGRRNGGIVIANPNAPTGLYAPLDQIRKILDQNQDSIVIVDEAYIDFGGASAISLLPEYQNLLVVQTFSKSRSLAGLRIGFAAGDRQVIGAMLAVRNSYNSYTMNLPAQLLGAEAVYDREYFRKTSEWIIRDREWSKEVFAELGFECLDSMTNFLFVKHPDRKAEELLAQLRREHILVRHFEGDRVREYLRISVGTHEQMEQLFKILRNILQHHE